MSSAPQEDRESEPQFMIPPSLHSYLQLAGDAARLFEQTSNSLALDDAIHAWEHILAHADFASADPGFRLVVFNDCAGSFLRRYLIKNTFEDINRAVYSMQDALEQIPPAMPLPSRFIGAVPSPHLFSAFVHKMWYIFPVKSQYRDALEGAFVDRVQERTRFLFARFSSRVVHLAILCWIQIFNQPT
jgi:hypothetical protein